jgi:hypothetical protein
VYMKDGWFLVSVTRKKGLCSVRPAYKMLLNMKLRREGWMYHESGHSNSVQETNDWTDLWNCKVPSKLKIFLWRLARHSLPTFDVMEHHHMTDSLMCVMCGQPDSWLHALIECSSSRSVWALQNDEMVEHMIMIREENAKLWLLTMHDSLSHVGLHEHGRGIVGDLARP